MTHSTFISRISFVAACVAAVSWSSVAKAADNKIVFQNGKAIPITSVILQKDQFVVKTPGDGFTDGQRIPLATADHVYGDKPPQINQALAILLNDKAKAKQAQTLLEPVVAQHKVTANVYGSFWLEAARVLLVAYAVNGDAGLSVKLGKEISDSAPTQGLDPIVALGKALLISPLAKLEEREIPLRDLTTGDNIPADVSAYASFFRGELLREKRRDAQALEAYLMVPCVFPTGGVILNAAAEIKAADLLANQGKREEALALATTAVRDATGTVLAEEAKKRLESLK